MLVYASESAECPSNTRGTLEAAHEAITSFFLLFDIFELEARVWWVFNHRAFLEALCIGSVLREMGKDPVAAEEADRDPLFQRARSDIGEFSPSLVLSLFSLFFFFFLFHHSGLSIFSLSGFMSTVC